MVTVNAIDQAANEINARWNATVARGNAMVEAGAVYEAPVGRGSTGRVVQTAHGYEAQLIHEGQIVEKARNNARERRAFTYEEAVSCVAAWAEHERRCGHA